MGRCRPGRPSSRRAVRADPALAAAGVRTAAAAGRPLARATSAAGSAGAARSATVPWPGPPRTGKASHRRPRSRQSRPSPADRRRQETNPAAQRPFSQAQGPCLTARGLVDLPGTSHKALLPLPYQFAACRMPKPRRPAYEGMSQQARRILHADQNQPWSLNVTRTSGCHVPYRCSYVPSRDSHGIFRSHFRVLERIGMGQFCWVADKTDIPGA
jgi:hypothetical protein